MFGILRPLGLASQPTPGGSLEYGWKPDQKLTFW
jgi:hypothetical protein